MASVEELWETPIIAAPMGGGPSTPGFVAAASEAGGLGFVSAGYKRPDQLEAEMAAVRAATARPFGVNLFVPGAPTADKQTLDDYLREIAPEAEALGVELGPATWDDDGWDDKIDVVIEAAPPLVSFTFGMPPAIVAE